MPNVPEWKKKKAFRLRLERKTFREVARECKLSSKTIEQLENGWRDKAGVLHPGWKDELERLWEREEQQEYESGLALKKERIATYERLARQVIALVEKQFPTITMKNASDAKALLSEVRELGRLISIERGEYHQGKGPVLAVKADITLSELRKRREAAKEVDVEEVAPPDQARLEGDGRDLEGPHDAE